MSESWHEFLLDELNTITFECSGCKAKVVFNAKGSAEDTADRLCPDCHKPLVGASAALNQYRILCRDMEATRKNVVTPPLPARISFRVKC